MSPSASPTSCHFAVLYRWRLHPGSEQAFQEAWERVTAWIRKHGGGLGSRLHLDDNGLHVAYAQWPNRAAWEAAQARPPAAEGSELAGWQAAMRQAVAKSYAPQLLELQSDLLAGDA